MWYPAASGIDMSRLLYRCNTIQLINDNSSFISLSVDVFIMWNKRIDVACLEIS